MAELTHPMSRLLIDELHKTAQTCPCQSLLKRNLQIFKSGDRNFCSLPGYEISKYFPFEFSKKLLNSSNFFENVQGKFNSKILAIFFKKKLLNLDNFFENFQRKYFEIS